MPRTYRAVFKQLWPGNKKNKIALAFWLIGAKNIEEYHCL